MYDDGHGMVVVERGATTTVSCGCVWYSAARHFAMCVAILRSELPCVANGGENPALTMAGDRDLAVLFSAVVSLVGLLCGLTRWMLDNGCMLRQQMVM